MKPWQWALLAVAGIIIIVIIAKEESSSMNPNLAASNSLSSSLGGLLGGLLRSGSTAPTKVTAPSGNPYYTTPGSSGVDYTGGGVGSTPLAPSSYGSQYSAAMASTGEAASNNAGSGGTTSGGGLSSSDPRGIGTLSAPTFDIGASGADFSN